MLSFILYAQIIVSMAAGGPILDSQTKGIVVTPICPHSLASPAMVFAQERKIIAAHQRAWESRRYRW